MKDEFKLPDPATMTEDELLKVSPSMYDFTQSRDRIVELEAFYWAVGQRLKTISRDDAQRLLDHATQLYGTLQPKR